MNKIHLVTNDGEFSKDFGLRNQIDKATVSIMANIAEGFDRDGNPEFEHFLYVSRGSCSEVESHHYVALDKQYISQKQFDVLYDLTEEVKSKIGGLISYLNNSDHD